MVLGVSILFYSTRHSQKIGKLSRWLRRASSTLRNPHTSLHTFLVNLILVRLAGSSLRIRCYRLAPRRCASRNSTLTQTKLKAQKANALYKECCPWKRGPYELPCLFLGEHTSTVRSLDKCPRWCPQMFRPSPR